MAISPIPKYPGASSTVTVDLMGVAIKGAKAVGRRRRLVQRMTAPRGGYGLPRFARIQTVQLTRYDEVGMLGPITPIPRERLDDVRFVPPASILVKFADGVGKRLPISLLEMPADRFRWATVRRSADGLSITVKDASGDDLSIETSTLRYLIDPTYAAEIDGRLAEVRLTREELREFAERNPPPPELYDQPA